MWGWDGVRGIYGASYVGLGAAMWGWGQLWGLYVGQG